jgi:hypothetical protein
MPITRILPDAEQEGEIALDVFHVQEAVEVYDGALALAVDHLLNHIKTLISLAYLPGSEDLEQALVRHPVLKRMKKGGYLAVNASEGRTPDRVLLDECHRLLDGVLEIAHLAAWPETAQEAQVALAKLRKEVPFLDYRYDNDPYPSDKDHEG